MTNVDSNVVAIFVQRGWKVLKSGLLHSKFLPPLNMAGVDFLGGNKKHAWLVTAVRPPCTHGHTHRASSCIVFERLIHARLFARSAALAKSRFCTELSVLL